MSLLDKSAILASVLMLTSGILSAAAPSPAVASPLAAASARAAKQSDQITQHVDALLAHRLKTEPLPAVLPNPFVVVNPGTGSKNSVVQNSDPGSADAAAKAPLASARKTDGPGSDADALARYAGALKIGGMIRLKDQVAQIVINGVPRKEGDIIPLKEDSGNGQLQLLKIMPGSITVRYKTAELTVKY